jgi:hypothetical protein
MFSAFCPNVFTVYDRTYLENIKRRRDGAADDCRFIGLSLYASRGCDGTFARYLRIVKGSWQRSRDVRLGILAVLADAVCDCFAEDPSSLR